MPGVLPTDVLYKIFDARYNFNYRGEWDNLTNYAPGDVVDYGEFTYRAQVPNVGVIPVNGATWALRVDMPSMEGVVALSESASAAAADAAESASVATTAAVTAITSAGVTASIVADQQAALDSFETRVGAVEVGQSSSLVAYATQALLYADLAHPEKAAGLVTNDPTPANNGTYRKVGASGAGSWVQSSFDRVAVVEKSLTILSDKRGIETPVKSPAFVNAIMDRYGLTTAVTRHGITNEASAITPTMVRKFNSAIWDAYSEPNTILITEKPTNSNYQPNASFMVTKTDLAKIGIVPNDAAPPRVSIRAAVVLSTLQNQVKDSMQMIVSLRYSASTLTFSYSATKDVIITRTGVTGLGAGDNFWPVVSAYFSDALLHGWTRSNIPIPATYGGQPFQGMVVTVAGYSTAFDGNTLASFEVCRLALVAGDTVSTTENYKNYPDDYIGRDLAPRMTTAEATLLGLRKRREIDAALKPTSIVNAVTNRYGLTSAVMKHGYGAGLSTGIAYTFDQALFDAYGEPNAIRATGVCSPFKPSVGIQVTPADLAAIGIVPNDAAPPRISVMAGFVKALMTNQVNGTAQIWVCLRYSNAVSLSFTYNSAIDVIYANGGTDNYQDGGWTRAANVASQYGANDATWNCTTQAFDDTAVFGWTNEGIPVPATYKGNAFKGIIIAFIGSPSLADNVTVSTIGAARLAVVAGSTIDTTRSYRNYPDDHLRQVPLTDLEPTLQSMVNQSSDAAKSLAWPPLKGSNMVNAITNRYSRSAIVTKHGKRSDGTGDITSVFNQALYDAYGEPNSIKIVETPANGADAFRPNIAFMVTPADLAAIGIVPNDAAPPRISLMAAFLKASLVNQTIGSLQIWISMRYSASALNLTYDTAKDAILTNSGGVTGLAAGDAAFWTRTTISIDDTLLKGWALAGIPVPATRYGQPFKGMIITMIGSSTVRDGATVSAFEVARAAVIAGSTIDTTKTYRNLPDDITLQPPGASSTAGGGGTITLANVDRVGFLGDSFTDSYYSLLDKAYISKVSQFLDFTVENFARSGDDYPTIQSRILTGDKTFHQTLTWKDYNVRYAVLISAANDAISTLGQDQYLQNLQALIETVQGEGAEPIISSEFNDYSKCTIGLKLLADRLGLRYMNLLPTTKNLNRTPYGPFWGSGHPGTRTNNLLADMIGDYLARLPRPMQALKIFRKRAAVAVSTVDDLLFRDNIGRARLFREITIGHTSLTDATANKYDEVGSMTAAYVKNYSEYLKLQNGESLAFSNGYALVDCVLPTTARGLTNLVLKISEPGATVYIRDVNAAPYSAGGTNGLPEGHYVQLISDGIGSYTVPSASLKGCLSYDKASFLIYKNGGFNLTSLAVNWGGTPDKIYKAVTPWEKPRATGPELLAQPLLDAAALAAWTTSGAPAAAVPTDSVVPRGATACTTVTTTATVLQAFAAPNDDYQDRELQVAIHARYFPAIFSSASAFPDAAPITYETFDYATMVVEISTAGQIFKREILIGLHWREAIFETLILSGTTAYTIKVYSKDNPIQVAKVSCKMM